VHAQQDIGGDVRDGCGPPPAPPGFDALVARPREVFAAFPDRRKGKNKRESMLDAALGAFAVFFAQSPSFLASQKAMQKARGQSNARTLFGMARVPTDNQVRTLLDAVPPETLHPALDALFDALGACGFLDGFHGFRGSRLVALDGTTTGLRAHDVPWRRPLRARAVLPQGAGPRGALPLHLPCLLAQDAVRMAGGDGGGPGRAHGRAEREEQGAALGGVDGAPRRGPSVKTKGYHLEQNFGHGELHLSNTLVAMNILAFLLHTCLDAADGAYRLVRSALPGRQTFFEHLRALTTYLCFPTWDALLDFMMQGLELGPYEPPPKPPPPPRRRRAPRQAATGGLCPDGATPA
jgi:hypothetical protein